MGGGGGGGKGGGGRKLPGWGEMTRLFSPAETERYTCLNQCHGIDHIDLSK